ncbi:MAG: hypothetical protein B6D77_07385 [gamma proteobacterium symbiont of Ctena orbiculata]|nr:MAG: hypothetical protein B6D77_07385 [gamma proteobacterium symbiont of Ctena orbiculata]
MDKTIISALLLLAWPQHVLHAQEPVAELKTIPFQESYLEEAPVSGRVIAGVTLAGYGSSALLSLLPPASAIGSSVCVQVMTRDGRYWSKNTFQLPGSIDTTPVALEYPSEHQEYLKHQNSGDITMLGSARNCSETDTSTVFLSSTGVDKGEEPVVSVYVNSSRSDTYLSVKNDVNKRRPVRCQTIQEGRRTGYDTICKINLNELAASPDNLSIKIIRRRYERMLPATEFTLKLPKLD